MTSNNSVDTAILDLRPTEDESPLLLNCETETTLLSTIRVPSISRFRVTNILRAFFFGEFLSLLIIWLAGNSFTIVARQVFT